MNHQKSEAEQDLERFNELKDLEDKSIRYIERYNKQIISKAERSQQTIEKGLTVEADLTNDNPDEMGKC